MRRMRNRRLTAPIRQCSRLPVRLRVQGREFRQEKRLRHRLLRHRLLLPLPRQHNRLRPLCLQPRSQPPLAAVPRLPLSQGGKFFRGCKKGAGFNCAFFMFSAKGQVPVLCQGGFCQFD